MARDYKQIVKDAHEHSKLAKASSARHARDLAERKRVARDAAENSRMDTQRQRKREQFKDAASRKKQETAEYP